MKLRHLDHPGILRNVAGHPLKQQRKLITPFISCHAVEWNYKVIRTLLSRVHRQIISRQWRAIPFDRKCAFYTLLVFICELPSTDAVGEVEIPWQYAKHAASIKLFHLFINSSLCHTRVRFRAMARARSPPVRIIPFSITSFRPFNLPAKMFSGGTQMAWF